MIGHETWVTVAPCESAACVQVLFHGDGVRLRSSRDERKMIELTYAEWVLFADSIRNGLLSDV